jgi:hypothetical protein
LPSSGTSRTAHQTTEEFTTDEGAEPGFKASPEVFLLNGCAKALPNGSGDQRSQRSDAQRTTNGGGEGGPKKAQDHRKHVGSPSVFAAS